jgi:hypothetical protein
VLSIEPDVTITGSLVTSNIQFLMFIYLDETIHSQYGFMLIAYVMCESDPQRSLSSFLVDSKEFHSCEKMVNNDKAQALRRSFVNYINEKCKWGLIVCPDTIRWNIYEEIRDTLLSIQTNLKISLHVFFDENLIKNNQISRIIENTELVHAEICKSHEVFGIQLADLVASFSGIRLKEEISQEVKLLEYGKSCGFEPSINAPLGSFELWSTLRSSMYHSDQPLGENMPELAEFNTEGYGLFFSKKCSIDLKLAAEKVFGKVYLGCFH